MEPGRGPLTTELLAFAQADAARVLDQLGSRLAGLSEGEAEAGLKKTGPNTIAREKGPSVLLRLFRNIANPLVLLLSALAIVSYLTGDHRATVVIVAMIVLGVGLRSVQERKADNAASKLQAMVGNTATVVRGGTEREIRIQDLVPGDILQLSAGDMVPADARILSAKDLFLNQSALTGEALPVERKPEQPESAATNPLEAGNLCFMGTNVESGTAIAVALHTGDRTYLGSLAKDLAGAPPPTRFDKGIGEFTWMMIRFIAVMVPAVFLIAGFSKHDWSGAFLFAMAVAVGLTPEMLPMLVTVNLSKGALAMARKQVIVKRLDAIQNFGAMDVLCTDKTGTLTQGKVVLEKHLDPHGDPSEKVLAYGYLNSFHHTGLRNLLDEAILDHEDLAARLQAKERYKKIDEIPFDFKRRRMSVVVGDTKGLHTLICKGAVDEVTALCTQVELASGQLVPVDRGRDEERRKIVDDLNAQGFRVIALGYKELPGVAEDRVYSVKDETDLVLLGFLAFLDPPKESAKEALERLARLRVKVKVLTGDNDAVAAYICKEVGMETNHALTGSQVEAMDDPALELAADEASIFSRLAPAHKERIIRALQRKGHVVGFLGDGINDAPALKAADVGISVKGAVDIAKESSDIILLENNLLVLEQGVLEGRRVFGNIVKYIKMAASSNFGNMFSVVGACAFLPFLPLLPIQVLCNNLLYDFSQTTLPTDGVDQDWLEKPRQWKIGTILRFILYVGPISSVFDYLTFFFLLYVMKAWDNPALFRTGWFVESLFSQTLIIHVIRTNKVPFLQSLPSWPLAVASIGVVAIGAWLTVSPLADALGFVRLPAIFWIFLAGLLPVYAISAQLAKTWFVHRHPD